MDEIWGAVIGSLGLAMLLITPYIVNKIIKYKLEIARINSETTIRAEEIRSKNQLELEKYFKQTEDEKNNNINHNMSDEDSYGNSNKSRVRI